MQRSSKNALGAAALLFVALIGYLVLRQPAPPDQYQIIAQIESARAAGEQHDVGGVMRIISGDYSDGNGLNAISLRAYLSRGIRGRTPVRVTLSPPTVIVQGDTATSICRFNVRRLEDNAVLYDNPVTLMWKREEGHRYLVLPTKVWRVVSDQYEGGLPGGEE